MATFTSVTNGNWNDGATWGKTSPGVKGTDWPGNAGDVVNIGTTANQSHVVTYNVSETNELGQITIGATSGTGASRLEFSRSMNTKLTLGHQDILCQLTGELRVGASGAILPKQYLAEVIWNTTADAAKGLSIAAGGKLNIYGDPDYYGSDYDTILAAQVVIPAATNTVTITVVGDFTGKWVAGQEIVVHKGGSYASSTNDFCRLAITGLSANGANTDIVCTVTERPAALTCLVGADVINVSRNVLFYKYGYNGNLGQNNTNRPRLNNLNTTVNSNVKINSAVFAGWNNGAVYSYGVQFDGVVRNSNFFFYTYNNAIINVVSLSTDPCASLTSSFISGKFLAGTRVGYSMKNCNFSNIAVFGMGTGFTVPINCKLDGYFYSCGTAFLELTKCTVTGSIGYDVNNVAKANTTNYGFYNSPGSCNDALFLNTKLDSLKLASQNAVNAAGRVRYEHYLQVNGAHYVADVFGDIVKTPADGTGDNPTQRNGGGADILEAVPQSNCAAVSYLELLTIRLWATAGVSRTYRFYVQTDFAALLATALKLYGEYLDQVSGGHLATVSSTQDITTRATPSDWSQYVEVTINPARDGYVNLYLRLMGYEAGKKVWIDPVPAGVTLTPRWSYGEVVLEPIRGGNASSTNLGLVPLGIKQVAI